MPAILLEHLKRFRLFGTALALATACGDALTKADTHYARPHELSITGDYATEATSTLVDDEMRYTVTITNLSTAVQDVRYSGCWLYPQLFADSARGQRPVFDAAAFDPPVSCIASETHFAIPVGASRQISGGIAVAAFLERGTPPGRYFVTLYIAPNNKPLALAAGTIDLR